MPPPRSGVFEGAGERIRVLQPIESKRLTHRRRIWRASLLLGLACVIWGSGCTTTRYITQRPTRENSLATSLQLMRRKGPQVSERTGHVLRRFALQEQFEKTPAEALDQISLLASNNEDNELAFALAELAYIEGKRAERSGNVSDALHRYGMTMITSHQYLFSPELESIRNPYDPQFRLACDLYNEALEDTLRLLAQRHKLRPGQTYEIKTPDRECTIEIIARGKWSDDEFKRLEFVSDFQVQTLNNRHVTYGLGVPMLAVRQQQGGESQYERFYPDGLSYAVTAMLRCTDVDRKRGEPPQNLILEFFDPLTHNQVELASLWVPLETDLTTPLAYFLDSPQFRKRNRATEGLLNPAKAQDLRGLYMLEPYDPNRIPVVMVHGLWSSPLTWMDMFNDLRSFPEVRQRYQFWFYMYPSGQPFWISATQMRSDLARARETFDPQRHDRMMDQMVLVGHSMGGLVSRMQTIDSREDFWKIVSDQPPANLRGTPEAKTRLASALFFKPNQSIRRVVTIATPHRGSDFANDYTRWLARRLIRLPALTMNVGSELAAENPGFFKDTQLLTVSNAIDSLAPNSPIFPVLQRAVKSEDVRLHNIVGVVEHNSFFSRASRNGRNGDGVVDYASASLAKADSEIIVAADHMSIHSQSPTILEVRRILLEHLRDVDAHDRVADRTVDESNEHEDEPIKSGTR